MSIQVTDAGMRAFALLVTDHREIDFAANGRTRRERQERYAGALTMYAQLTGRNVYEVDAEVSQAGDAAEPLGSGGCGCWAASRNACPVHAVR